MPILPTGGYELPWRLRTRIGVDRRIFGKVFDEASQRMNRASTAELREHWRKKQQMAKARLDQCDEWERCLDDIPANRKENNHGN